MHEKVDTEYANGRSIWKVLCAVFCPNACRNQRRNFCSEFVALFHESIELIQCNNSSQILPSDYGHRKGLCSLQYLCCCLAYIYDARTFKYYKFSDENILDSEDCPLYILDNTSIKQYIRKEREQEKVLAESASRSGSAPSTAVNSPSEVDLDATAMTFEESLSLPEINLLCSPLSNKVSSSLDLFRSRHSSITEDIQRMSPRIGKIKLRYSMHQSNGFLSADEDSLSECMYKISSAPVVIEMQPSIMQVASSI